MKTTSVVFYSLLLATTYTGPAGAQLIPAGSLIQCTTAEPKLSSKTEAVGDPIICQVAHGGHYGGGVLPYGSSMVGRFEAYKDPGHFVGKGWMELKFDRMVIGSGSIPMDAKVVDVAGGYGVNREGRILGKGHAKRDAVEWMIPVLWPIDVINLPRSGPRPSLKAETRLTVKLMDDIAVPWAGTMQQGLPDLLRRTPSAYTPYPANTNPVTTTSLSLVSSRSISPVLSGSPVQAAAVCGTPLGTASSGSNGRNPVTLIFRDGRPPVQTDNYMLTSTKVYVMDGSRCAIPVSLLDVEATATVNRQAGVDFRLPVPPIQYR